MAYERRRQQRTTQDVQLNTELNAIYEILNELSAGTAMGFDGGDPTSDYSGGPVFDCGGVS